MQILVWTRGTEWHYCLASDLLTSYLLQFLHGLMRSFPMSHNKLNFLLGGKWIECCEGVTTEISPRAALHVGMVGPHFCDRFARPDRGCGLCKELRGHDSFTNSGCPTIFSCRTILCGRSRALQRTYVSNCLPCKPSMLYSNLFVADLRKHKNGKKMNCLRGI